MGERTYIKGVDMPEDISVQILSQASENIQKLFELSTRIDERVKSIQEKQQTLEDRIEKVITSHQMSVQKIAVLEAREGRSVEYDRELSVLDKRLVTVESISGQQQDRWNKILTFVIQLVWVILAAWLLLKLNLQPPNIP